MLPTFRRLVTIATAVIVMATAAPAAALELAPAPPVPKPNLWAEIEPECFGAEGSSPGIRWKAGNQTNGSHILSVFRDDVLAYDVVIAPGEVKTGALHSHLWEDSHQRFEVRWKNQDQTLAKRLLWMNCTQPELAVSFDPTDPNGLPCAGPVTVTVANSGTQHGQVRILDAGGVVGEVLIHTGASASVDLVAEVGSSIAGTVWDHGAHEFFFGVQAVACTVDLPEPPAPPGDQDSGNDGGNDGDPKIDEDPGEPGGTWQEVDDPEPGVVDALPDPVMAAGTHPSADTDPGTETDIEAVVQTLESEIRIIRSRHAPNEAPTGSGGHHWAVWLAGSLLAAAVTRAVLSRG